MHKDDVVRRFADGVVKLHIPRQFLFEAACLVRIAHLVDNGGKVAPVRFLSLIHISEPTRLLSISYAVFCLKKKKKKKNKKKKKKKKKKRKEKKEKYYVLWCVFFFLMIRRPQRSTRKESSAASDVYKRQI